MIYFLCSTDFLAVIMTDSYHCLLFKLKHVYFYSLKLILGFRTWLSKKERKNSSIMCVCVDIIVTYFLCLAWHVLSRNVWKQTTTRCASKNKKVVYTGLSSWKWIQYLGAPWRYSRQNTSRYWRVLRHPQISFSIYTIIEGEGGAAGYAQVKSFEL